jgi:hypothetical protein
MALNSSGPISLGGATTGQSINIELGQSATALASINATNFRSLAGVPSGQIALSNFYGKSSVTGYVIYLGTAYSQVFNATGDACTDTGWQVNNVGSTMFTMGRLGKFTIINNAGTTLATTAKIGSDYAVVAPIQYLYPAGSDRFVLGYNNAGSIFTAFSGSSSYTSPVTGPFTFGGKVQNYIGMPDNSFVSCAMQDQGKYGFKPRLIKGTGTTTQNFVVSDNSMGTEFCKILRYSDGSFVYLNKQGSDLFLFQLSSNLTGSNATRRMTVNYAWAAEVDSSNNIYFLDLNYVYKIPSNFPGTITKYQYDTVNWATAYINNQINGVNTFGMGIYNDILYIASNGGSATDSGSANPLTLTVVAITCSTMNVLWTKRFVCNGAWKYFKPFTAGALTVGGAGIQVRSTGVHLAFAISNNTNTNGYGYGFTMMLPLDGNVSNQTFTPNDGATPPGGNVGTITITSPTTTRTTTTTSMPDPGGTYTFYSVGGSYYNSLSFQAGSAIGNPTPKTAF